MEKSKLLTGNNGVLYVVVLLEKQDLYKEDNIKRMWEETCQELQKLQEGGQDRLKYSVL